MILQCVVGTILYWVASNKCMITLCLLYIHCVVPEVLSVVEKLKEWQNLLSAQCQRASPSQLCYILVQSCSLFQVSQSDVCFQIPERALVFKGFPPRGSCLRPQASLQIPAGRLSRWCPPAFPPLSCQPCPATRSPSPPPVPEN